MAQSAGRDFLVRKNGVTIAAVRQKNLTVNNQPIVTTNDDDDGFESYLTGRLSNRTMEISVEGLTDDDVFSDIAYSPTEAASFFSDLTLQRANGDVIAGNFILTSYTEQGSQDGEVTFTATLVRNGAHTFTAA